jgi:hypothetical protein
MKKIISFSLYGDNEKYTLGALCNVELAKIIYPDWICRFYCGGSVPTHIIDALKTYENTEIIPMSEDEKYTYMSWRFLPIDDDDVDIMISRDADSRLSFREKKLVDIFVESNYLLHDIRDHTLHNHIMGGIFGIKKEANISMKNLLENSNFGMDYGADQAFLRYKLYPILEGKILVHDSELNTTNRTYDENFPIKINEKLSPLIQDLINPNHIHFIGEIFPYNNYGKPKNYIFY